MNQVQQTEEAVIARDRVRDHSSARVNEGIDQLTRARVEQLATAGPVAIGRRLAELDQEWDVDRALMALFPILGGSTFKLGMARTRPFKKGNGWLYLFGAQMGFLLLHATVGWCPPAAVLRRLGFRTAKEISVERVALESIVRRDHRAD
jgi:hypothetical protein